MILLESGNRILGQTCAAQINPDVETDDGKAVKREPIDVRLCDFDDVSYRVIIDSKDKSNMKINMSMPFYSDIEDHGGKDEFEAIYGEWKCEPTEGYDLAISVNLDTLPEGKREEMIKLISLFKTNVVGGVFKYFYKKLAAGKISEVEPFKFDLRPDTTIYFVPLKDRVTTFFTIDFQDEVDKVVCKVFMQEFKDARKTIKYAPAINFFQTDAPEELKRFDLTQTAAELGILGWLSFAVLDSHVKSEKQITEIAYVLQSFRNYIQYHIKCAKSYFHSRMRAKCGELLKVLNRAKQKQVEGNKKKKTASGKTFTRK